MGWYNLLSDGRRDCIENDFVKGNSMRRRDLIAAISATSLTSSVFAGESTILPEELPSGTRQVLQFVNLPDKRRMIELSKWPPNYEAPVDVFTETVTPNDRFFVRYHLSGVPSVDGLDGWALDIGGDALSRPIRLRMSDLLDMPSVEVLSVCHSAGNRRGLAQPHVVGLQWGEGAMGAALWRGPSLAQVLQSCGVKSDAVEVWVKGADRPTMQGTPSYQKSIPIEKAMDTNTILAISMNGAPLPLLNGYPARLVLPGWVGTYWIKHVTDIEISTRPLANFWMSDAYRVPNGMFPAAHPFQSQATKTTSPVTELLVSSLIADPLEGHEADRSGFNIRGIAWDRGSGINRVEVSLDAGDSWQDCLLDRPLGPYAYRRFSLRTGLLKPGTYRLMSRATSLSGETQANHLKQNPGGYYNNVPRAIPVLVT